MGKSCDTLLAQMRGTLCHNVAEESRYISMYIDSYSSAEPIEFVTVAV
jgi:hypothetical protein